MPLPILLILASAAPATLSIALPAPPPGDDQVRTVEVEVYAERRPLWRGELRFSRGSGANVNESVQQAAPTGCTDAAGRRAYAETSLRLSFSDYSPSAAKALATYTIDWNRPGECNGPITQRAVRLTGQVDPTRADPITVNGDAGLEVRLRFR